MMKADQPRLLVVEATEQRLDLFPVVDPLGQIARRGDRLGRCLGRREAGRLPAADESPNTLAASAAPAT